MLPFQTVRRCRSTVRSRAVALWHARYYNTPFDALLDLSGNGLHARLGSAVGADSNDPLRLQYSGSKYLYCPAVAGNYPSAPDSAPLRIIADIDLRGEVALDSWTPAAECCVVGRWRVGVSLSYALTIATNGCPTIGWTEDGATIKFLQCPNPTGLSAFTKRWIRATLDVDNGAAGRTANFYTSTDGGTWTLLGSATAAGVTSIAAGTAPVTVGARTNGADNLLLGRIYRAQIYDGIAGTKVFDFDASLLAEPYASVTDVHGNVITLNRSSTGRKLAVVDRDLFLLGTDDYFEVADHPLLDFEAKQAFTAVALTRRYALPDGVRIVMAKQPTVGVSAGWNLTDYVDSKFYSDLADGSSLVEPAGILMTYGATQLRAIRRLSSGAQSTYLDQTESSGAGLAAPFANSSPLRIGSISSGGSYSDMEFIAAAVFREALSAADLVRLKQELLTL